jgi:hypothetical protein
LAAEAYTDDQWNGEADDVIIDLDQQTAYSQLERDYKKR